MISARDAGVFLSPSSRSIRSGATYLNRFRRNHGGLMKGYLPSAIAVDPNGAAYRKPARRSAETLASHAVRDQHDLRRKLSHDEFLDGESSNHMAFHHRKGVGFIEDAAVAGEFHKIVSDEFCGFLAAAHFRIHEPGFEFLQQLFKRRHA